ncbi:hypothetical protein DYL61_04250 [Pseudomonas nabeulensis]|nr:hypothetical protein [Pseudomonas nabeulensis]TFY95171.1 hypothetical protein DYL61_04250 [Pseudomonas nabeulensis]
MFSYRYPARIIVISAAAATFSLPAIAQTSSPTDGTITELEAVTVTAPPLNKALEVNAGAFGAKDTMEIPISIQSYSAKTIAESSARTVQDVL